IDLGKGLKLSLHQLRDANASLTLMNEKIQGTRERADALRELGAERVEVAAALCCLSGNSLHDGEQILCPMAQLVHDKPQALLPRQIAADPVYSGERRAVLALGLPI